ncbi:carbon-nitrogen hydrolase [Apiospora arundinis]|uniref:Carbon-nitrogen hydrolase n=1 Tax=Apiospora arundinis TaxID=335852 RepID=A0ABR2HSB5_9PEZI
MRIGCLQFARRTETKLSGATPKLPYFAEPTGASVTSLWTRTVASRYRCTVAAGYHEAMPNSPRTYQSVIVVSPQGETLLSSRRPFHSVSSPALEYFNDCDANHIPGIGLAIIASVNDLATLEASTELARRICDTQPKVVILSAAEVSGNSLSSFGSEPNKPDSETVGRWIQGLAPLRKRNMQHETIFVFANCSGIENGATIYTGTSAILGIQRSEVRVYGILSRTDRELLVVNTSDAPVCTLTDLTKDHFYLMKPVPCSQPKTSGPPLLIPANPVDHDSNVSTPHPTTLTRTSRSRRLISQSTKAEKDETCASATTTFIDLSPLPSPHGHTRECTRPSSGERLHQTSSSFPSATAPLLQAVDLVTFSKQLVMQVANIQNTMWSSLNSDQGGITGASFF